MNKIPLILLVLGIVSCNQVNYNKVPEKPTDNPELLEIYQNDQADRQTENINWDVVLVQDSLRQISVQQLLDSNKVQTSNDYHNAAMIFQHGMDTIAS
jgi:hypothetical protein